MAGRRAKKKAKQIDIQPAISELPQAQKTEKKCALKPFIVFVIIIILIAAGAGLYQYNQQKSDFESVKFGFGNWRMINATGNAATLSVEYSVENPTGHKISLKDFDLTISYGRDSAGTKKISGFPLDAGQKIERTFTITLENMNAQDLMQFIQNSDVAISGMTKMQVLFLEIEKKFDYDGKTDRMVFG